MHHNKALRAGIAALWLVISQLACQTLLPTPTPVPTSTPTASVTPTALSPTETPIPTEAIPFSDAEITSGIQQTLDLYGQAYRDNDPELLESLVDSENKPFRRMVRNRFDDFQASYQAGQIDFQFRLMDIKKREYGFVIAHFETDGGYQAEWPFRYFEEHWVLSEPTVEQIGEPVTTETEHFVFTSYPWAEDFNPLIIELMETARGNVEKVLGQVPTEKANVEILPIYGLHPFDSMDAVASYFQGQQPTDDQIQIYTPDSFSYSFYDPEAGWERELEQTLTHEYTHLTHTRSFDSKGRLADWVSEGLAEYVSGADENSYWACDAMVSGTFIPILDESGEVYKQDLMHMYLLEENFGLSYDFATSLVEFTIENYGGLDGFWKLAEASDNTSDFKKAVQDAFGISYDEYNSKWQAWLKKKC